MYAFGQNSRGECGLGHVSAVTTPTLLPDAPTFVQLSGGSYHSMGVTADGEAYTWVCLLPNCFWGKVLL